MFNSFQEWLKELRDNYLVYQSFINNIKSTELDEKIDKSVQSFLALPAYHEPVTSTSSSLEKFSASYPLGSLWRFCYIEYLIKLVLNSLSTLHNPPKIGGWG